MFFDRTSYCFCGVSYVPYDGDDRDCGEGEYQHACWYHGYEHYEEGDGLYCHALMYYGCE